MSLITNHYNRPSYTISNEKLKVYVTVEGGHLTADFFIGGRVINPFFIAPWWKEAPYIEEDKILNVLRGDFFCFPFGGNDEEYNGIKFPIHGETSNNNWLFESYKCAENHKEITLKMDLEYIKGSVIKKIEINENEPIIYSTHTFENIDIKAPIGHHPTLKLPEEVKAAIIDMSTPVTAFSTPYPVENPENGGYSRIKPGEEIKDLTRVPTIDGNYIDITKYPTPFGYEDILIIINDNTKDFTYTSVTIPSKGYLYFQLKNPKTLNETLLWMSNGGRHYSPWNGRIKAVIGVEEITAFFHYGIKPSVESNMLQKKGYKTYVHINPNLEVKIIMGVIPISTNFNGVKDIVKKNDNTITIIGKNGENIDVPCRIDFLSS